MLDDCVSGRVSAFQGVQGGERGFLRGATSLSPVVGETLDDWREWVETREADCSRFGKTTEEVDYRWDMAEYT